MGQKKFLQIIVAIIIIIFGILSYRVIQGLPSFQEMSDAIKSTEKKVTTNVEIIEQINSVTLIMNKKIENAKFDNELFLLLDRFMEELFLSDIEKNHPSVLQKIKISFNQFKKTAQKEHAVKFLTEIEHLHATLCDSILISFKNENKDAVTHLIKENSKFVQNVIILSVFAAITFLFWVFNLNKNIKRRIILENSLKDLTKNLEIKVHERTKELEDMLYVDSLTKLSNAFVLKEDISKSYFSTVIMIRLNDFGRLNQLYGASAGNVFLLEFTKILKGYVSTKKYNLYRYAGVEFALFDNAGLIDTEQLEEDIEELIELAHNSCIDISAVDEIFQVDISIGIASGTEKVLDKASTALRYSREHNRSFTFYNVNIDRDDENRTILDRKKDIKKTLDANGFIPVFQPIVDKYEKIVKYEALMRMISYDGKKEHIMTPNHFLDIALKTNLYHKISEMVMHKTIDYFKDKQIDFSLNFTLWDMENKIFIRELETLIKEYDIGERVIFEIVETESIDDYAMFKSFINRFKKLGVRIAIDDFGSGYSNFSYVMDVKPDYIKIDGSLIKNIDQSKESYILVKAIVELSRAIGIKTIAEFVRSSEIFEVCKELGIDEFQGYIFSRPLRDIKDI